MNIKTLKGITWNHSRAFPSLVAVSQRYEELHPGIRIQWSKRTLDEFGHKPIDQLIKDYDLIVIDHPWAGFCFDRKLVLNIKNYLSNEQWAVLAKNCVGAAFESYTYENKLLAVPIDMAAPVPSWRPDLLEKEGVQLPSNWRELIALSDRKHVIMPAFEADLFLNWLMLLYALGAAPFEMPDIIAEKALAVEAMSMLKRLAEPMSKAIFDWNPIAVAEKMTHSSDFIYCPFAYSYNNYCRLSFVNKPLRYGNLVRFNQKPLRSILGGTGIAISNSCTAVEPALDFLLYCADAQIQSGIYTYAGGQPVRKEAWSSPKLVDFAGGFFSDSYSSHEDALIRPRYNGYVPLQKEIGKILQEFMRGNVSVDKTWVLIHKYYRKSRD